MQIGRSTRHGSALLLLAAACIGCVDDSLDTEGWYRDALAWDTSPVDLSFLNERPAGSRGRVIARGSELFFEDGTPARFWGCNLQASALFRTPDDEIRKHARRLARLGFNLVRFAHHDSMRWVDPVVIQQGLGHSQSLDERALARLDQWITALRSEGIYIWLDLHAGRIFQTGDAIPGFDEIARDPERADGRGFVYVNPRLQQLMRDFNEKYLLHVNPHTGISYLDDPAIIGVVLSNENDVTDHYGNLFLRDKRNPFHTRRFQDAARYFSGSVGLEFRRVLEAWDTGPAKIWLSELAHRFNTAMRAHLASLGSRKLVATTNYWGRSELNSLPSLADGDVVDAHVYGTAGALRVDPRQEPNFPAWIAPAQIVGKPTTVTEWNLASALAPDRATAPIYLASLASFQGWDALMLYGYSQQPLDGPGHADPWSSFNDPALIGSMPAAALLYRARHAAEAERRLALVLDRRDTYFDQRSPATSAAIRTAVERHHLSMALPDIPELDWDGTPLPDDVQPVRDLDRDYIEPGLSHVTSDTGQLRRDWAIGLHTVDTPRSQIASGAIGGHSIELGDVGFDFSTPEGVVAVSSLDGEPISSSRRMLVTALARAVPASGQKLPFLSEPVLGQLRIRSRHPGLELAPLAASGAAGERTALPRLNGIDVIEFPVPVRGGTHWFLLTTPGVKGP